MRNLASKLHLSMFNVVLIDLFQTCCSVGCGVCGLAVALVPAYNEERFVAPVLVLLLRQGDRVNMCDDGSLDLMGEIVKAVGATEVTLVGDG